MKLILVVESSCNQPAIISSTTAATTTEIIMTSIPTASEFIIYRILLIIRLSLVNRYLLKYLHEGCCWYISWLPPEGGGIINHNILSGRCLTCLYTVARWLLWLGFIDVIIKWPFGIHAELESRIPCSWRSTCSNDPWNGRMDQQWHRNWKGEWAC